MDKPTGNYNVGRLDWGDYVAPGSIKTRLRPNQVVHENRCMKSVVNYGWYFDTSPTGTGKTPTAISIKQDLEAYLSGPVKLVVIGPKVVKSTLKFGAVEEGTSPWRREAKRYGVREEDYIAMSYTEIIGSTPDARPTTKSPKYVERVMENSNGFLMRLDTRIDTTRKDGTVTSSYYTEFMGTEKWVKFLGENNVLLILDEAHAVKNASAANLACAALIREIKKYQDAERADAGKHNEQPMFRQVFGLLSATPFDKEKHAIRFFIVLGVLNPDDPIRATGKTEDDEDAAINKVIKYCALFDDENLTETTKVFAESPLFEFDPSIDEYVLTEDIDSKKERTYVLELFFNLMNNVVFPVVQSAIVDTSIRQVYNGFFRITRETDLALVLEGLSELQRAVRTTAAGDVEIATRRGEKGGIALGRITNALLKIEEGLIFDTVRKAIEALEKDPTGKVVVAGNYVKSVNAAIGYFRDHGYSNIAQVGGFGGKKSEKKIDKEGNVNRFQNDPTCRILVMTAASGGTGIDLQDLYGNEKRYLYIIPNYNLTNVHQTTGRVFRVGAQSIAEAYIVYALDAELKALETRGGGSVSLILNSLAKKSGVMRSILKNRDDAGLTGAQKVFMNTFVKLPGEYDRYFEMPKGCEEYSYVVDNQVYRKGEPIFKRDIGFLYNDDAQGRLEYKRPGLLYEYLVEQCEHGIDPKDVVGVAFNPPFSKEENQYKDVPPKQRVIAQAPPPDERALRRAQFEAEREALLQGLVRKRGRGETPITSPTRQDEPTPRRQPEVTSPTRRDEPIPRRRQPEVASPTRRDEPTPRRQPEVTSPTRRDEPVPRRGQPEVTSPTRRRPGIIPTGAVETPLVGLRPRAPITAQDEDIENGEDLAEEYGFSDEAPEDDESGSEIGDEEA